MYEILLKLHCGGLLANNLLSQTAQSFCDEELGHVNYQTGVWQVRCPSFKLVALIFCVGGRAFEVLQHEIAI